MSVSRSVPLCVLLVMATPAAARDSASMTGEIIDTIEDFEAAQDAKCYATATRLENFIFGTPLSDDARFLKIDLQKQIILQVWREASDAAGARGAAQVEASDVEPLLQKILPYREDQDKNVVVTLPDRSLVLAGRDFRHYSSIAYALRAILAVQQDQMWMAGSAALTPLDPEAVSSIRKALDVMTLASLAVADEAARGASEAEVSAGRFTDGWAAVVTSVSSEPAGHRLALQQGPPGEAKPRFSTFRAIVDQKIQSYDQYNAIEKGERAALFLENIKRFYAKYYIPPGGLTLPENLGRAAEEFVGQLVELAQASAAERGEPLIRARDMNDALQRVTPHHVDDLEDVTFFPNLAPDERVVLAAFDLDSFRDFGMHWRLLQVMLDMNRVEFQTEPDPFAAELIAEGLAQYSVLLLRIAGQLASSEERVPFMRGTHLARAGSEILRLAALHRETPAPMQSAGAIRSSGASGRSASTLGAFMTDVTGGAGIDFDHRSSDWMNRFRRSISVVPPTFSGGGIAAGDVDGDGHDDLLYVGGIGNALYLGDGAGHFSRSSQTTQLNFNARDDLPGEARQPIIADLDNDGDQDVLITYVDAPHRVLENQGGKRLVDATSRAKLGGEGGVAGPATVFDFDRDGLLDVYICYFGNYLEGYDFARGKHSVAGGPAEDFPGQLPSLARNNENGMPNRLFRNRGGLQFEEVENSGADDQRWCQAVSHTDFDGDGYQDLVVANDFGRNSLLRNLKGRRFEDVSEQLGMTHSYHSMNVGLADLNADLHPDIYVSNINMMTKDNRYVLPDEDTQVKLGAKEMAGVHIVETSMLYISAATDAGLAGYVSSDAAERGNQVGWAWDAEFFDFDNDGDDDLYVLNGANEYFNYLAHREIEGDVTFDWNMEPNVFYQNEDGALKNVSKRSGADFAGNSRSAVYLDYDSDGDLDVALNNFHGPATFFRNDLDPGSAHFIKLRLEGDPAQGSNRDAIGARILLRTDDGKQIWREIHGGSGYLSMEPKEQHAGLGASQKVDVTIHWPGGGVQEIKGLSGDRTFAIRENEAPRAVPE